MNPKVDKFLGRAQKWQKEMEKLRKIALECGLTEELKWGKPCYTSEGKNIIVIQGFKEYCALLFLKGYLLNDPDGILIKTGENTVVGRQIRFTAVREIVRLEATLKTYIYQAIEVERSGVKPAVKKEPKLNIPEEFQTRLDKTPTLKKAFNALSPGRQKAYVIYFSAPKQSKTRETRIEKCMRQILAGKGLNDD
ncbi:MAG TPA: DUF1801 domain-containing protein [Puia sp.]|jgi:uncharacterized protein YdeI (YjbR/CyaY-like superfamily)|nr:DUF1801 domain-containing protein [Puia sp.]